MNENEISDKLKKMWGTEKDNFVLVKSKDPFFGYTIMDSVYNAMVIIEDNDIAKYAIKKMLESGVRVVDDFETVRNPNKPDPIFYTPELEAQYRKLQEQKKNEENKKIKLRQSPFGDSTEE